METISIKALAIKVIEGNRRGNQKETKSFLGGNQSDAGGNHRKPAHRIYSDILGAYLWVVEDDHQADILRASEKPSEPIYTFAEARELKKLAKEDFKPVHLVKTIFADSKVELVREGG